jgi:hypothetical protein
MTRIYVTEPDTDSDYYDRHAPQNGPTRQAGWFSPEAATYWHGIKGVFDGANLADVNTRDQNRGQGLYRTAKGRWVLRAWSNWQGETDAYSYTSPEDAREWLIFNEYDEAVRTHFGEIEEERGPELPGSAAVTSRYVLQYRDASGFDWEEIESYDRPGDALVRRDQEEADIPAHMPRERHRVVDLEHGAILEWHHEEIDR